MATVVAIVPPPIQRVCSFPGNPFYVGGRVYNRGGNGDWGGGSFFTNVLKDSIGHIRIYIYKLIQAATWESDATI